ncbi:hypothetical protein [Streptosporangium sp. NPDC050280]|uniref:hypothetical protein n=1 Tax=unclassified Streptosporangium TaxID=2632669 RepID=UPI0034282DEE
MAAGQPLSRAEVELVLNFEGLSEELREGLERRVKAAAAVAAKELTRVEKAASGIGTETQRSARTAETAVEAVQRGAKAATVELDKTAKAAARVGVEAKKSSDEAADTINRRLVPAATKVREALAAIGERDRNRGGLQGLLRDLAGLPPASQRAVRGLTFTRQAIISVIAAAAGLAPAFAAAGAGAGAFGLFAVPTITKVIKAQTEMADEWASLTDDQKIAAVSTSALVDEYKALSASLAPDTLRVYNAALTETRELLPELVPLARTTATELAEAVATLGDGFDSDRAQEFFSFLERSAPGAISGLVSIVQDGGAAAAALLQALASLAPVLGGVVAGTLQLVTAVSELSPELVQLLVTTVALRGPVAALGNLFSTGVGKVKAYSRETKGASLASKVLTAAAAAGPNIYLAGAAALGIFAISLATAKTRGEELVDAIQASNLAVRNNVDGYRNANRVLAGELAPTEAAIGRALQGVNRDLNTNTVALAQAALAQRGLSDVNVAAAQAMEQNRAALNNIDAGARAVAAAYGITTGQAIALADAVGVDLSQGVTRSGTLTAAAAGKFAAYQAAVQAAQNPTLAIQTAFANTANEALNLTDRVKALQAAFDLTINPSLALYTATTRVRDAYAAANTVLAQGNATSQARRTALQNLITTLRDQANAEFNANQSVDKTSAAFRNQLPTLTGLAGKSRESRALVNELAGALAGARTAAQTAGNAIGGLGGKADAAKGGLSEAARQAGVLDRRAQGAAGNVANLATQAQTAGNSSSAAAPKVDDLANSIQGLKSKNVTIRANTAPAQAAVQSFIRNSSGKVVDVTLRIGKTTATAGATGGMAEELKPRVFPPGFAAGGKLRGPGTGTSDSIIARLSTGEFVVNAKATKRYENLLRAINSNKFATGGKVGDSLPRFATGGLARGRNPVIDLGALLGTDLARGLARSQRAIDAELGKISKAVKEKLADINRSVGADFVRNLVSASPEEISRQLRDLQRQISAALKKTDTRVDNLLVARLTTLNAALGKLATERDRLAATVEKATQTAADVTERARSSAALSTLTDEERATPQSIAAGLRTRLKAINTFQDDIARLQRRGAHKSLIEQLVTGGPDQSGQLAASLSRASTTTLREINELQRRINADSKFLGRESADFLFDSGVNAGRGFLAGLKSQQKEITALMTAIAKSVSTTIRKELKIKSPSRRLRADGRDTGRGYLLGLQDLAPQIERAARQMVAPVPSARTAPFQPARAATAAAGQTPARTQGGSSVRDVTFNNTYTQVMASAPDIWAEQERQLAEALR